MWLLRNLTTYSTMRRHFALLILIAFISTDAYGQHNCRDDQPRLRSTLERLVSSDSPPANRFRTRHGIPQIPEQDIRVLNDTSDSWLCQYIATQFAEALNRSHDDGSPVYYITYYTGGGYYFGVQTPAPHPDPEVTTIGLSTVVIFDETLNYRAASAF